MGKVNNVSKKNPCPICGKSDWCFSLPSEDGKITFCHRVLSGIKEERTLGTDGKVYVFIKSTNECGLFVEEEQHKRFMEQNKYNNSYDNYISKCKELNKVKDKYADYEVEEAVKEREPEFLDKVYRRLLDLLVLENKHYDYLLSEGWNENMLKRHSIASMPPYDYARYTKKLVSQNKWRKAICEILHAEFGDLTGVPGFYMDEKGAWKLAGRPGILFPTYDINGCLIRIHVRAEYTDEELEKAEEEDEKLAKYLPVASYYETIDDDEKRIYNHYKNGCAASGRVSIYKKSGDTPYIAIITEGQKKGIVVNEYRGLICVSLPGVSTYAKLIEKDYGEESIAERLYKMGVRVMLVCFDADKEYNVHVLQSEMRTVELMKNIGFRVGAGSWNVNIAKGIDDLVVLGMNPTMHFV